MVLDWNKAKTVGPSLSLGWILVPHKLQCFYKNVPFLCYVWSRTSLVAKGTIIPSKINHVNRLTQHRDDLLHELWANLVKAQDQMRKYANQLEEQVFFLFNYRSMLNDFSDQKHISINSHKKSIKRYKT